ncbi:MAG: MlaD family protein [Solirubrobacteraceae bacterium]
MSVAIRKHWKDFAAIVGIVLLSAVVGVYILANQRFHLPHWVPLVGSNFVTYKAELSTAQSVTPGQGQTVQIAGVDVGEITNVSLVGGRAVVTMTMKPKYTPIYKNASALLRPKTGLNDMVLELTPGDRSAGAAPAGWTIPVSQTLPNVNFDEVLSALDGDTRNYLQLLVAAGGQGLGGQGKSLSAALKRFEPTGRYLAKLNGALALRDRNIRRSVHNFRLLAEALGAKDNQLAQLVDSSNAVFRAFANQDVRLRQSLRLLPGTLSESNTALGKVDRMARVLGPTLGDLRPAARALGPSLKATRPFLRDTTPVIRDQLRPFARDALPVIQQLRPVARDLAQITPKLTSSFKVVNYLLNELAYNPPGKEEGYLFWTAWANHDGNAVFNLADAHGPVRRGLVVASCTTLGVLDQIGKAQPQLGALASLLNAPATDIVCPRSSQPGAAPTQGSGTSTTPAVTTPTIPTPTVP